MRQLLTAAVLLAVSSSCNSFTTVHGSGLVLTENRAVSSFHAVDISGGAQVFLTQGDVDSLDIECDDNLLPHILASVTDGVLRVRFERGSWSPSERPVYRISANRLDGVRLHGSVRLEGDALHGDDVKLHLSGSGIAQIDSVSARSASLTTSGSGDLRIGHLTADDAHVGISGSGEVTVSSGEVGTMDVRTSGSGELAMEGVEVEHADLRLSGSGTAQVWVAQDLEARVSGSGEIGYRGRPTVHTSISGSGEVYPMSPDSK
ncbi:MAG: hypothetical protein ACJAZN_002166 [Planctomycetota bacterium]|jgi:hypothetical protein